MTFGDLLEAALAGTQRHPAPAVLPALAAAGPEQRLLRGASYAGLRRLAGRPPERAVGILEAAPAPPEVLDAVPKPAAAILLYLLERRRDLLAEWLGLAVARRLRAPHACVPELLECARDSPELETHITTVGGQRLTWLAQLNPDWSFAAPYDAEELFAFGTRDQRARAFRHLRQTAPGRARELFEQAWTADRETAALLLPALATGLSANDEPLVDHALHSPRTEVRELAVDLIRRIPGSAFAHRWSRRARHTFILHAGPRLEIRQPSSPLDPEWQADGLELKPPKGIGPMAWLLQQTLGLAPPSIWPREMLDAVLRSDWARPLVDGLTDAAIAYADTDWCETLVLQTQTHTPAALIAALEPARAEAICQLLLERGALDAATVVSGLEHHRQWTPAFSEFLLMHIGQLVEKSHYVTLAVLTPASLRLHPGVLELAEELSAATRSTWAGPGLRRLVQTLDLRRRMQSAFGANTP